jgi:hypothetical protein
LPSPSRRAAWSPPRGRRRARRSGRPRAIMHSVTKGTTSEYVCRLDRHRTGNGERCRR